MIILGITASSDKNAPSAPTIGTATDVGTGRAYNNAAVTVSFTAPTYTGGSPITSYTVTSNTGGYTATGASSPLTVTGIPSNTTLTFTVTATNASGFTSPASSASNSVTATTVPQAPTIGTATAGDASATVTFTAGATGGKTVSTYTATSSPGSITGTSATSPITVSGLTNGTAYTFTVTATNANGTSTASAASNSVSPAASGAWNSIASVTATGSENTLTISGIPNSYTHLVIRYVNRGSTTSIPYVRFNGWSSGYQYQIGNRHGTGSPVGVQLTNQAQAYLGRWNSNDSGSWPTVCDIIVLNYSTTGEYKVFNYVGMGSDATVGNRETSYGSGYLEGGTSAISSFTLSRASGTFGNQSTVTVYGIA